MKLIAWVLWVLVLASPAVACSKSASGDYLLSSGDPTLPVLLHGGRFIQCSSVFDPDKGQVLDCGHGAIPLRNPDTDGVLWGKALFKAVSACPALPADMQHED